MSYNTDVRKAVAGALAPIQEQVSELNVMLGPNDFTARDPYDLTVLVRVAVGPPSAEAMEALDALCEEEGGVKALLEDDSTFGGVTGDSIVAKCSGQVLFPPSAQGEPLRAGAEWTIKIVKP